MMNLKNQHRVSISPKVSIYTDEALYGAAAGAFAAVIYVGAMSADMALTGYYSSDVQLVEGLVRGKASHWPWIGLAGHLVNGAGLGVIYSIVQRWLPGPAWLRGTLFSESFVLLVFPATSLVDRYHPLIRRGTLPPFARRTVFLQNLSRHLIFGVTLGETLRWRSKRWLTGAAR